MRRIIDILHLNNGRIGAEERGMDIEVGEGEGRVGDEVRKVGDEEGGPGGEERSPGGDESAAEGGERSQEIVIERAGEEVQTAGKSWAHIYCWFAEFKSRSCTVTTCSVWS